MNKSIMELLEEISGVDLLLTLFLIIALIVLFLTQKEKFIKQLNKWRKTQNEEDNFHNLVYSMKDSIENLSKVVKQNQENRDKELLRYRDDSRKIREEMYKVMDSQSQSIDNITKVLAEMRESDSKTKRAEIKEKIERIYRECHPSMSCTDMQFEVLKELIEEYEEHGGINSFVHSTVEPEMYKWKTLKHIKED